MEITLRDGRHNELLDLKTFRRRDAELWEHAMRYHVVDPRYRTAREKLVCDKELAEKILQQVRITWGVVRHTCTWIHVANSLLEIMADTTKYRRIVEKDLQESWGNTRVEVTGIAVRKIWYNTDDGDPENTPNRIGIYSNGYPLVYRGHSIGVIFKIDGKDVLQEEANVVYWLPRKWWNQFHSRYRKVPRPFPGRTGFVCSNWCQRSGHAGYKSGNIYIADMTQAQTVGGWSRGQLQMRHGSQVGGVRIVGASDLNLGGDSKNKMRTRISALGSPFGMIGTVCPICHKSFSVPLSPHCGKSSYKGEAFRGLMCKDCGWYAKDCKCEDPHHVEVTYNDFVTQKTYMMTKYNGG